VCEDVIAIIRTSEVGALMSAAEAMQGRRQHMGREAMGEPLLQSSL